MSALLAQGKKRGEKEWIMSPCLLNVSKRGGEGLKSKGKKRGREMVIFSIARPRGGGDWRHVIFLSWWTQERRERCEGSTLYHLSPVQHEGGGGEREFIFSLATMTARERSLKNEGGEMKEG